MLGLLLATLLAFAQDPALPAAPADAAPVAPPVAPPANVPNVPNVPNVAVGHLAPGFSLPTLTQKVTTALVGNATIALSDFTGVRPRVASKVVVLTFVRRVDGDAPLRELQRIHRKYNKRGVEVVAIVGNGGTVAETSGWIQKLDLSFPVAYDAFDVVVGRYEVREWPFTVVVDGQAALVKEDPSGKTPARSADDSGDVLALGSGTKGLASEIDVLLDSLVTTP